MSLYSSLSLVPPEFLQAKCLHLYLTVKYFNIEETNFVLVTFDLVIFGSFPPPFPLSFFLRQGLCSSG